MVKLDYCFVLFFFIQNCSTVHGLPPAATKFFLKLVWDCFSVNVWDIVADIVMLPQFYNNVVKLRSWECNWFPPVFLPLTSYWYYIKRWRYCTWPKNWNSASIQVPPPSKPLERGAALPHFSGCGPPYQVLHSASLWNPHASHSSLPNAGIKTGSNSQKTVSWFAHVTFFIDLFFLCF